MDRFLRSNNLDSLDEMSRLIEMTLFQKKINQNTEHICQNLFSLLYFYLNQRLIPHINLQDHLIFYTILKMQDKKTKGNKWSDIQRLKHQLLLMLHFPSMRKFPEENLFQRLQYMLEGSRTLTQCKRHHQRMFRDLEITRDQFLEKLIQKKINNRLLDISHIKKQLKRHLNKITFKNKEIQEEIILQAQILIKRWKKMKEMADTQDISLHLLNKRSQGKSTNGEYSYMRHAEEQKIQIQTKSLKESSKQEKNIKKQQQSYLFDVLSLSSINSMS